MDKNLESFDSVMRDMKKARRKAKIKEKFNEVKDFCCKNPEIALFIATSTISLVTFSGKFVAKQISLKKAKNVKELYCYDRSLGHYWRLKRELSNNEWIEIDRRKKNGERLADILDELKVLK